MPFAQTFEPHDLIVIAFLALLEGVLSIDNALVLGLLARRLPERLRPRALSYGLIGAFVFRILAIILAGYLLHWRIPKLLGGLYLLYVAVKHFVIPAKKPIVTDEQGHGMDDDEVTEEMLAQTHGAGVDCAPLLSTHSRLFWQTVIAIELTDIAFAVDSIVAAIAMISATPAAPEGEAPKMNPKLWLVVVGGMLGVVAMRFAAAMFIKLLDKFPRFETSAYLLVLVIGGKLVLDYAFNDGYVRLDFHNAKDPAFWAFWLTMLVCMAIGFIRPRTQIT
jgi:YkoY family integral membrane protein